MLIINIDSDRSLTASEISFIESVMVAGEKMITRFPQSMYFLSQNIPVFLLKGDSMPEFKNTISDDSSSEKKKKEAKIRTPATELLGIYCSKVKLGYGTKRSAIYICPERIEKYSTDPEHFLILLTKVIIHEFAHALMHSELKSGCDDVFYGWMEEPLANMIVLEYFESFQSSEGAKLIKSDSFQKVKDFISTQPPNYSLGLDMFDSKNDFDWKVWRDYKKAWCKSSFTRSWIEHAVKRNIKLLKSRYASTLLIENKKLDELNRKTGLFN